MPRKERRAQALAERKQRKKRRPDGAVYAWMAGLLQSPPGRVLEVGTGSAAGAAALASRGWHVVPIDAGALLARGEYTGRPLDAVTCWLLDVREARPELLAKIRAMGLQTADEGRLAVQTLVYRLADRVLRPGGVLQIVDRMNEPFGEALAAGVVRLQRAQSSGTSLEFASIDARPEGGGAYVSVQSRQSKNAGQGAPRKSPAMRAPAS